MTQRKPETETRIIIREPYIGEQKEGEDPRTCFAKIESRDMAFSAGTYS
jgi:hypothetical protein